MKKRLDITQQWHFFHLCSSCDIFDYSVLIRGEKIQKEQITHLLNETVALEVLPGTLTEEDIEPLFWIWGETAVVAGRENRFFIVKSHCGENDQKDSKCLRICRSREFTFGHYLIPELSIGSSFINRDFQQLCFAPEALVSEGNSLFHCMFRIDERDVPCFYTFRGQSPSIDTLSARLMKSQKESLSRLLNKEVAISTAGPLSPGAEKTPEGYELEGHLYSSGGTLPYRFRFPRKLLNLLPDQECSTIKGKILQTNRLLFRGDFDSFHLSGNRFLLDDLLTLAGTRDLNIICQNFVLSNSLSGEDLRKLFYYKIPRGGKDRMTSLPFSSRQKLLEHLPLRIREEFITVQSGSENIDELLDRNSRLLEELFKGISEGKLLLSSNIKLILQRETGTKLRENGLVRLKKLMSKMGTYHSLMRLDGKTIQIFLGTLNHRVLCDLFVYQPKNIVQLKQYLSRNRFNELMEDIRYTQNRIKTDQIDINRVCDSIERFNREAAAFIRKEKEKNRRDAGKNRL
ncbi:MAG: hypothetical protein JXR86_04935 [Spirochaetales bacterium]|nr:hypothetical protein [Spirochaetales bacterium]